MVSEEADRIEQLRDAGHLRLFSTLKRTHNGLSDPIGNGLGGSSQRRDLLNPALVLHSLRHPGIHKLNAAGTPHNGVEALAGHAASGVHRKVYQHRVLLLLPMSLLRDDWRSEV